MSGHRTVSSLTGDIERLKRDRDRYKRASEIALAQLEACADYAAGKREHKGVAPVLRANRDSIRKQLSGS